MNYFIRYGHKCFKAPASYQESQTSAVDTNLSLNCYVINTVILWWGLFSLSISTAGCYNKLCWPHPSNEIMDPRMKVEPQTTKDKVIVIVEEKTGYKTRISKGDGGGMISSYNFRSFRQGPPEAQGCCTGGWWAKPSFTIIHISDWSRGLLHTISFKLHNIPTRGTTGHNWGLHSHR